MRRRVYTLGTLINTIAQGDCFSILQDIPSASIDLVVTDPPYYNVAKDCVWDSQWSTAQEYLSWLISFTVEVKRILKDGGAFYIFGGIGPRNGFIFWDYVKYVSGNLFTFCSYINWRRFRGKGYKGVHNNWPDSREDIAYFIKGAKPRVFNKQYMNEAGLSQASKKRFEKTGQGLACTNIWIDITEVQLDGGLNRTLVHPAMKPVSLIERIVRASSNEGDIVVDPFLGSGTAAVACLRVGRRFIGIELDPRYCALAKKRVEIYLSG